MKKNVYMDYSKIELLELARIIKEISTEDTEELKINLEKQINKKIVLT